MSHRRRGGNTGLNSAFMPIARFQADILTMCRRNTWLVCTFTLQTLSSQQINAPHSGSMLKTWAGQS